MKADLRVPTARCCLDTCWTWSYKEYFQSNLCFAGIWVSWSVVLVIFNFFKKFFLRVSWHRTILERQFLKARFFGVPLLPAVRCKNQTRDGWVRSANASSVLCRPLFLIGWKLSYDFLKQPIRMLELQNRVDYAENLFYRIGSWPFPATFWGMFCLFDT